MNILNAPTPEARWPGPSDTKWDLYYNDYEQWVNDHYDVDTQSIFGRPMTYDQAIEDEALFDAYVDDYETGLAEARAGY